MSARITVIGPRDTRSGLATYLGSTCVNTTSRAGWSSELSPFRLGPVKLYGSHHARIFENAWQFAKVYPSQVDENNDPTDRYWNWAFAGWCDSTPRRYPMGKGARPLYSLWNGQRLGYVEARKQIYVPLYAQLVVQTEAYRRLQSLHYLTHDLYLWDYDGYKHRDLGMDYAQVLNDPTRKMGHAFVLAMLLEGLITVDDSNVRILV